MSSPGKKLAALKGNKFVGQLASFWTSKKLCWPLDVAKHFWISNLGPEEENLCAETKVWFMRCDAQWAIRRDQGSVLGPQSNFQAQTARLPNALAGPASACLPAWRLNAAKNINYRPWLSRKTVGPSTGTVGKLARCEIVIFSSGFACKLITKGYINY